MRHLRRFSQGEVIQEGPDQLRPLAGVRKLVKRQTGGNTAEVAPKVGEESGEEGSKKRNF